MSDEILWFGDVLFSDEQFSLSEVSFSGGDFDHIAVVSDCLKLRKVIASIPIAIREASSGLSEIIQEDFALSKIVDSGINQDLNPFLIVKKPKGNSLASYRFSSAREISEVLRKVASAVKELHRIGQFQRDLDPNWDIYYDGRLVTLCFPAARHTFHKAYVNADDGATVFDVPRFIVTVGSVREDVTAIINLGLSIVVSLNSIEINEKKQFVNFLENLKNKLDEARVDSSSIIDDLCRLDWNYEPEIKGFVEDQSIVDNSVEEDDKFALVHDFGSLNKDPYSSQKDEKIKTSRSMSIVARKVVLTGGFIALCAALFFLFFKMASKISENEAQKDLVPVAPITEKEKVEPEDVVKEIEVDDAKTDQSLIVPETEEPLDIKNEGGQSSIDQSKTPIDDLNIKDELPEVEVPQAPVASREFMAVLEKVVSKEFEVRVEAAKALPSYCESNREDAQNALRVLLKDPDILVRGFSVYSFAECLGKKGEEELKEALNNESSEVVRSAILKSLKVISK